MKKLLVLIVMLCTLHTTSFSQQRGFSENGFKEIRLHSLANKVTMEYLLSGGGSIKSSLSSEEAVNTFSFTIDTMAISPPCAPYKNMIADIYRRFPNESVFLEYKNNIPLFLPYKESNVLVFQPLMHTNEYNSARLNDTERAAKTIKDVVMPIVFDIAESLKADIKYYGVSICYGVRDFTNKYGYSDAEYVLVIIPVTIAKDFALALISENELVRKSDIYLSNIDDTGKLRLGLVQSIGLRRLWMMTYTQRSDGMAECPISMNT